MTRIASVAILLMVLPCVVRGEAGIEPRVGRKVGSPRKPYFSVGAYKWMVDARGDASGTVLQNFNVKVQRTGVELTRNSGPFTIRDGEFSLIAPTTGSNLPVSVSLVKAHDVLIENVFSHGFQMVPLEGRYTNGDGFSSEREATNITFRNTRSEDNSDGGYDMKGSNVLFEYTVAARNGKNYRIWLHDARGTIVKSINPEHEHIELNSRTDHVTGSLLAASLTIDTLIINDTVLRPIASLGPGTSLTVRICRITMPKGDAPMVRYHDGGSAANTTVSLGEGCSR